MEATATGSNFPSTGASGTDGNLNKVASSAHQAVDSVAGKVDEAARKAGPVVDRIAKAAHQAVDSAASAAAPAADWIAEQGEHLNEAQKKLVDDLCKYVSANPMKSLGIALAAGFLISRMTR
jgi:ElaB/YqjD/DUF883 family membrane-anchored ribosome-binding protein